MIERELRMHFIAYHLIRCIMQKAVLIHNADLVRISFKGCLDTLHHFANATCGTNDKSRTISALIDEMLLVIAATSSRIAPFAPDPLSENSVPKTIGS